MFYRTLQRLFSSVFPLCIAFFLGGFFLMQVVRAVNLPSIDTLILSFESAGAPQNQINLVEASYSDVYLFGDLTITDGCSDIRDNGGTITATLYRSGVSGGSDCVSDKQNCYHASIADGNCALNDCDLGTETTSTFECIIPVKYYADPTDSGAFNAQYWIGQVSVFNSDLLSTTSSVQVEMNSLSGVQVDNSIPYGELQLGEITTSTVSLAITNTGNTNIDVEISGNDMICGVGSIPVSFQKFSTLPDLTYEGMTSVSTSFKHVNINLSRQVNDETLSTSSLYFKIATPTSSIQGECFGENIVNAVLDE